VNSQVNMAVCLGVVFWLCGSIWACGYRPVRGADTQGLEPVFVPVVENRTSHADLTAALTSAIRRGLARKGVAVSSQGAVSTRLEVAIVQVSATPGMLGMRDSRLVSIDNTWDIQVDARLLNPAGETVIGPEIISVRRRVFQGGNALAEESLGRRKKQALLDEISAEIAHRFFQR